MSVGLTLEEATVLNLDELASWNARWPVLENVDEISAVAEPRLS
jgi:hypothetical protein